MIAHSRFRLCFLYAVISITLGGCNGYTSTSDDGKPKVLCTTSIIADAAKRIGGDAIHVDTLMGPGIDPHRHLPSGGDMARVASAQLIFHNGLHLEGKMTDIFEKSGSRAVAVTRTIDPKDFRKAEEEFEGTYDPHVWFDVKLWMKAVECVRDELCRLDPGNAETFRSNAAAYLKELEGLEQEIRDKIAKLPQDRRVLVTSHDAFGYFGRAYGFEVHGLQGVSTASEVGIKERVDLARLLGTKKVPAVFTETSVPPEGLKSVLDTTQKDWKHTVNLVGGDGALYSDALGEPNSPGGTYTGMIRHNVDVIVAGLSR